MKSKAPKENSIEDIEENVGDRIINIPVDDDEDIIDDEEVEIDEDEFDDVDEL